MVQKYYIILLFFWVFPFFIQVKAQNFVYVNYTPQQGLANSIVYKAHQDKEGFLWFVTETGVSRFDGTRFVNFTTKEGLPSNEIINIFEDSQGRIWLMPFKNTICYYYKGKIYSPANDSLLAKIKFKTNVWQVAEDGEGRFFLREDGIIHVINPNNHISKLENFEVNRIGFSGINTQKRYEFYTYRGISYMAPVKKYEYTNNKFYFRQRDFFRGKERFYIKANYVSPQWLCQMIDYDTLAITNFKLQKKQKFKVPDIDFLSYTFIDNNTILFNTRQGSWQYDFLENKFIRNFLPDKNVCNAALDIEGNLWFCTLGQGIYKLSTQNIYSLSTQEFKNYDPAVFCLSFMGDKLIAAGNNGIVYEIKDIQSKPNIIPHKMLSQSRRIATFISVDSNNLMVSGGYEAFFKANSFFNIEQSNEKKYKQIAAIKEFALKDKDNLLIATSSQVLEYQISTMKYVATIFNERATCVAYRNDTTYIGTFKGLYVQIGKKPARYVGDLHPFLKERISKIVFAPDGQVWIATYDYGLINLKNLKFVQVLNQNKGLTSDFCRTMRVDNNYLWVGTAKGLNRIDLKNKKAKIIHYTYSTGLVSNVINDIVVKDHIVYVATPDGISYFQDEQYTDFSVCKLHLLDIKVNGQSKSFDKGLVLHYQENNLKIGFTAISYRSEGDITYQFRIKGLQDAWQTTKQNELLFPSLPSGEYIFQIKARNKFGIESDLIELKIHIQTPFWQSIWFNSLVLLLFLTLIWQIARRQIAQKAQREIKRLNLARKIADLEQTAIKAQMEPHFIFNCLTSIQNLVLKNDSERAYTYMNKFARLVRQTLEYASRTFISVSEEIQYLENYLFLEQLQMAYDFQFQIEYDSNFDWEEENIPVMLLQPYVENALKHAFADNLTINPQIKISFSKNEGLLTCQIEDNGMGRQKSMIFKSQHFSDHQSKGMELANKRIETLRLLYGNNISINIEDKKSPDSGTLVKICFG